MGAYTEALDFLREIGASAKLRVQPRLRVALAHPELGLGEVAAPAVPGPLQAPLALLVYRLLAGGDRVRLFAGALRLAARGRALARRSVAEALADVGQSPAACMRFWHPLAIATLNESPETAAAAPFAAVLRRAFFARARAARFALATVPLSELYTTDARRAIEAAGGTVLTSAAVASLALDGERVGAVRLRAARWTRSLVVRERHATISLTPAADAVRPTVTTPLVNLFLAGDWVQTGLPATIEGAVQAGREAAGRALAAPVAPTADVTRGS